MRSGLAMIKFAYLLVGMLCIPVLGQARLFLVPAGDDPTDHAEGPTEITLKTRQSITLEIYVENTAPLALRFYAVTLDSATGGETGIVDYQVGSDGVSTFHHDFVFFCYDCGRSGPGPPAVFFGFGGSGVEVTAPKYLGQLSYAVSNDACGSFVIDFIIPDSGTQLLDSDQNPIPFVAEPTVIHVLNRADLNSDGQVDLADIRTVYHAFRGFIPTGMDVSDIDIASKDPCDRDGVIDLLDIIAVLDGSHGVDQCPGRCSPVEP